MIVRSESPIYDLPRFRTSAPGGAARYPSAPTHV